MLNDSVQIYYGHQLSSTLTSLEKWENGVVKEGFLETMMPMLHHKLLVGGCGEGIRRIQREVQQKKKAQSQK